MINKKFSWITIITGDSYLPGVLVLNKSLIKTGTKIPLLVLLTPSILQSTKNILEKNNIFYKVLDSEIGNPTDINKSHRWYSTYSKLMIFDQVEFDKIVFLDADMLILRNIDNLFEKPHMSAVNSGSMLPRKKDKNHLNSGLLVIEPNLKVFEDMFQKIGKIENLTTSGDSLDRLKNGNEEDFLNLYFPDWVSNESLHLDHGYNMIHYQLDEYNTLFGFTIEDGPKPVYILHFASYFKPWQLTKEVEKELESHPEKKLELYSIKLWMKTYEEIEIK